VGKSDATDPQALAKSLTSQLGGLPSTIAQVAAYILDTGSDLGLVLELLSSHQERSELIIEVGSGATMSRSHTPTNVWDISLSQVPAQSNHLLQLLCLYDSDAIPESLFLEKVVPLEELERFPHLDCLHTMSGSPRIHNVKAVLRCDCSTQTRATVTSL
jgi:hypothetical protein